MLGIVFPSLGFLHPWLLAKLVGAAGNYSFFWSKRSRFLIPGLIKLLSIHFFICCEVQLCSVEEKIIEITHYEKKCLVWCVPSPLHGRKLGPLLDPTMPVKNCQWSTMALLFQIWTVAICSIRPWMTFKIIQKCQMIQKERAYLLWVHQIKF